MSNIHYLKKSGFTIVELLIVIVVIGILAAITVVAYGGIQDRAKVTKANTDLAQLSKAIQVARLSSNKILLQITGTGCTSCSDPTGSKMVLALTQIALASNTNLDGLKSGDPWGNRYSMDENEGEGGSCANRDFIGLSTAHVGVSGISVPFYNCSN
ncbi:type II secretion system protein [Candidatus Saccharibacteria bacterium]|nr:type II secretion system protein [Candidatus Saccharibacteria bacterium]